MKAPTFQELIGAKERLKGMINRTPLINSEELDNLFSAELLFKCENLQNTGSFKARGALNSCLLLQEKQGAQIVATHSSGNHGRALAWAAQKCGFESIIVVPENAPEIKLNAILALDAKVVRCGPSQFDREAALEAVLEKNEAHFIPPFEYTDVIAGQSTCVQEILDECSALDTVFCPVGGGGLAAGSSLALKHFSDVVQLILCEPEMANDAYRSLRSDTHIKHDGLPKTIADGLRTNIGKLNLDILRADEREIHICSEESILRAMKLIWEKLRIVCEPSSAVPLAVIMENPHLVKGKRVAIIISGGNVRSDFWA